MKKKALTVVGPSTKVDLDHHMGTTGLVKNDFFQFYAHASQYLNFMYTYIFSTYISSMKIYPEII